MVLRIDAFGPVRVIEEKPPIVEKSALERPIYFGELLREGVCGNVWAAGAFKNSLQ